MSTCTNCNETTRNRKHKAYPGILCKKCRKPHDEARRALATTWFPKPPGALPFWHGYITMQTESAPGEQPIRRLTWLKECDGHIPFDDPGPPGPINLWRKY